MITAIMIDSREPDYFKNLKFGSVPTMVTMLETGDVQAVTDDGCTLIFERKTLADLLNSIADKRIFMQLARMTEIPNAQRRAGELVTQYCYLIVTDPITCTHDGKVIEPGRGVTGWTSAQVMGAILSIQELGVFVYFCNGQSDYEKSILSIGKRNRSPETYISAPRPAKMLGPKFDLLAGIPGVEIANGQKILEWSNDNIAHALVGLVDLDVPAPIPFSTRKRFRDLLGLQEGERIEIVGTQILEPITQGDK